MYVIGVDGGTTKTVALLVDMEGQVISAARGAGSNWTKEDVSVPMEIVANIVRTAMGKAGVTGEQVRLGMFTLAGADWPEDHERREAALMREDICKEVIVKNDAFGGLRAGTNQPYGMVLAAGTGFNAAVITPDRKEWAFGYYETFGGARTIVRDAIEAVLRAEDGRGQKTTLTKLVLDRMQMSSVEALLRAIVSEQLPHSSLYVICPLVFEAALEGDDVATSIIVRQGEGLSEYITAMARRFDMQKLAFDVVLAGSVFKGIGPLLEDTIRQRVHRSVPYASVVRAKHESVVGSVLLAYDALGIQVNPGIMKRIEQTLPLHSFFDTSEVGYG